MTNYAITGKDLSWFIKNYLLGQEFALADGTGSGTDNAVSYDVTGLPHDYGVNGIGKHIRNVVGGSHSHTAKTGYKIVNISSSPHTYSTVFKQSEMPKVKGTGSHTNMPKLLNGSLSTTSGSSTHVWDRAWISTSWDTTTFQNLFYDFFKRPSHYISRAYANNPRTSPIYINDHNFKTPIYNPQHNNQQTKWL